MTEFRAEESLGYLLQRTAKLLLREVSRKIDPYGVSVGQWLVLYYLYEEDRRTQADLGRAVGIEAPTMVRTVDRMIRDGLVERRPDPKDARVVRITLTQKAVDLREPLLAAVVAVQSEAMASLGEAAGQRLMADLRRLITHLSTEPE